MKSPALFTYLWRAKYVSIPVNLGKQIQKRITQKIAVKKKKGCNCINELSVHTCHASGFCKEHSFISKQNFKDRNYPKSQHKTEKYLRIESYCPLELQKSTKNKML